MVSRVRASQWALVWAVAFAVVGMHHLATQEQTSHPATVSMTAAVVECCAHDVAEEHTPAPTEHHDSLHLCLAILAAVLGLALTLFALRGRADA
ncbi:MAG: hypothetical protein HOV94_19895 [Saccharothrix sp.]|nr:hypothetical protein [Saccharothrix sp.]